jgi:site-specific DNA-methyltransferase (adenine-specific)
MEINKIYNEDCLVTMGNMPDNFIDLTVTSPPYDNLRDYKGYNLDLHKVGSELFRVTKDGGMVCFVMQDQTKNFGKSLTTFKTAIDFCNIGFKLFECCIYRKYGQEGAWWNKRFRVDHEYILIFLKGDRPKSFNKEPLKIPSKHGGKTMTGCATRNTDGTTQKSRAVTINKMKCRGSIWEYLNGGDKDKIKREHPATFPDALAQDLVLCFSSENDLVYDCFMGSGTTAKMTIINNRNWIGSEISSEYCEIINKRISDIPKTLF